MAAAAQPAYAPAEHQWSEQQELLSNVSVVPAARPWSHRHDVEATSAGDGMSETSSSEGEDELAMYRGMKIGQAPTHIRMGFVRKVYGILLSQLALTVAIAWPFQFVEKPWLEQHIYVYRLATWSSLAVVLGLVCSRGLARQFPANYIMLGAYTVCVGIMVGFATAYNSTSAVLLALFVTIVVFAWLTAYACVTKSDFTGLGPYLFAFLIALVTFGFVLLFFPGGPLLSKVYAGVGCLLFSFYIIFDTQLIIGGKKHAFEVDDYVVAALNLYLDFVNMFLYILSLLGGRSN